MATFQQQISIDKPINEVYSFLADCNNHEQLMPDMIYNWSSTRDEARFTIQNMAKLALKIDQREENSQIVFVPVEKPPFDVIMKWQLAEEEGRTKATLLVDAELNMMMKMLASGPLQKLVDHQVSRLEAVFQEK